MPLALLINEGVEVRGNVGQLLLHVTYDLTLGGGGEEENNSAKIFMMHSAWHGRHHQSPTSPVRRAHNNGLDGSVLTTI